MSSASPLAAQTGPEATRSFSPDPVAPDGTVTVTVAVANYGGFGRVTETIPSEFAYVDGSLSSDPADTATMSTGGSDVAAGVVAFTIIGASSISYQVSVVDGTADGDYDFSGKVRHQDQTEADVGGDTSVEVATDAPPPPAGP